MKKNNNKGFTLAELLIVVAIIAVLVAIAIPVFTAQLEKAREATDVANVRSAYADVMVRYLADANKSAAMDVSARQGVADWQTSPAPMLTTQINGSESSVSIPAVVSGSMYHVAITEDASGNATVSVTAGGAATGGTGGTGS